MEDIELRLYKLEEKAGKLTPNGFTAKSFWTRVGTVFAYNLAISFVVLIVWVIIYVMISLA